MQRLRGGNTQGKIPISNKTCSDKAWAACSYRPSLWCVQVPPAQSRMDTQSEIPEKKKSMEITRGSLVLICLLNSNFANFNSFTWYYLLVFNLRYLYIFARTKTTDAPPGVGRAKKPVESCGSSHSVWILVLVFSCTGTFIWAVLLLTVTEAQQCKMNTVFRPVAASVFLTSDGWLLGASDIWRTTKVLWTNRLG